MAAASGGGRIILAILGTLAALLLLAVLGLGVLLRTDVGRARLADLLESQVAGLAVERIDGALPGEATISGLVISDSGGPWLRVGRARLDWEPWALLAGRLEVMAVEAWDVAVERIPEAEPAERDNAVLPRLPLPVRIDRATVHRLELAPAVAGEAVTLRAEASLDAAAADSLKLRANIVRLDREGRMAAAIDLSSQRVIAIDASVHEPPGGLIASLAGLPGEPAVNLEVEGEGTAADWKGTVVGTAGEGTKLDADVALDARGSVLASGRVELRGLAGGASWEPLVAEPLTFDLQARWQDERLAIERLALNGPAADAEATGSLDLAAETMQASAALRLRDPTPLAALVSPLRFSEARAEATVEGPLRTPRFTFSVDLDQPEVEGISAARLQAQGNGAVEDDGVETHVSLKPGDLKLPSELLRQLVGSEPTGEAEFVLAGGGVRIRSASLAGRELRATVAGDVDGDGALDLESTASLSSLPGLMPSLRGELKAKIARKGASAPLTATLDGQVAGLETGVQGLGPAIGDRVGLAANVRWEPSGLLQVENLRVEAQNVSLTGEATVAEDFSSLQARMAAEVAELSPFSSLLGTPLRGKAVLEATAAGPLANPRLEATLSSSAVQAAEMTFRALRVEVNARDLAGAASGTVTARAESPWGPARVGGGFSLGNGGDRLALSDLTASVGDHTRLGGAVTVPLDGAPATGTLNLSASRLAAWSGAAGVPLQGSGRLTVTLEERQGRQAAAVNLDASGVAGEFKVGSLRLEAALSDLLGTPAGEVSIAARGLEDIGISALTLRGEGRWSGGGLEGRLTALRADGRGVPIELRQPVQVAYRADGLVVEGLALGVGPGRLRGDARIDPKRADVALVAERLPLGALSGGEVEGRLDVDLRLQGASTAPEGEFRLNLAGLRTGAMPQPVSLQVDGDLRGGMLSANARTTAGPTGQARASLPVALSAWPPAVSVKPDAPLQGEAHLTGDLGSLAELFLPTDQRLQGQVDLHAEATGSVGDPRVRGEARLRNGSYENFTTGTLLRDLTVVATSDGQTVRIQEARASDGGQGRVVVSGSLGLSQEQGFPIDLRGDVANARLLRRDDVSAVFQGGLTMSGGLAAPALEGALVVEQAEVRIVESAVSSVTRLDVVEINGGGQERGTGQAGAAGASGQEAGSPWAMSLDVAVRMPRQIFVRGRGLESEWQGEVAIHGSTANPRIEGELRPVRGDFDIAGKRFVIEEGFIRFEGGEKVDPRLSVVATYAGSDLRVSVRIEGRASDPKITLTSVPPLPQDEMLARLLFGKSATRLSAVEAAQLAQALASLSGRGGPTGGILDFARNTLGLDRVTLGSDEQAGGPALQVGKYLNDRVYVGVEQGATGGNTEAQVEVELTPNLSLESDIGVKTRGNVGLKWQFDY